MHKRSPRQILLSLLKWLFSGGMLLYIVHEIDVQQVMHMLTRQNPLVPLAVIALMLVQMTISTFRWQRLIELLSGLSKPASFGNLFGLNFISVFFNSCLPGTIGGDVVRTMMLRNEKLPLTICAHSVIIDRLLAVLSIFLMVAITLPWLGKMIPAIPVTLLLSISAAAIPVGYLVLAKAPSLLARLPSTHLIRMLSGLVDDFRRTVFSFGNFVILIIQAVAAHSCFCLSIYLLCTSMGVEISLWDCLILIPPVLLLIMMPISVGGWGVREVSMVGFLALAGVPKEAALTVSVQLGILVILASLPGAWYYVKRRKPATVENASPHS